MDQFVAIRCAQSAAFYFIIRPWFKNLRSFLLHAVARVMTIFFDQLVDCHLSFLENLSSLPLTFKDSADVDPGREIMGAVSKEMENHKTTNRHRGIEIYRDQAIVEHFNHTLSTCSGISMLSSLKASGRLCGSKDFSTLLKKACCCDQRQIVSAKPSIPYARPVSMNEKKIPSNTKCLL